MGIFDFFKKKKESTPKVEEAKEDPPVQRGVTSYRQVDLNQKNINWMRDCFIAFDVETTGLIPECDRIVELGAVFFKNGKVENVFSSLVNPGRRISSSASEVNHITDKMLATAPTEKEIYPQLIDFLGDALHGDIVICAHNAKFDLNFLTRTLSRLGYDAKIKYVDTLQIARKYIHGTENYKQQTLEDFYGIENQASHRAASDAENCGHILLRLLDEAEKCFEAEQRELERSTPNPQEIEVCAFIQNIIAQRGGDTDFLRFRKNKSGYVDVSYVYNFLRFKFAKKGNYMLVKSTYHAAKGYMTDAATKSEGGTDYIRIYFASPFDLDGLSDYIYDSYAHSHRSMEEYIKYDKKAMGHIKDNARLSFALSDKNAESILMDAKERDNQ